MTVEVSRKTHSFRWVFFALLANVLGGCGAFTCAAVMNSIENPASALLSNLTVVWCSIGVVGAVGTVAQAVTVGELASNRVGLMLGVVAGCLNVMGMALVSWAMAVDPKAAGPTTAILPLGAIVVCVLAWVLLGEKLLPRQLAGIFVCISGPVCMSLTGDTAGWRAVLLGVVAASSFGLFSFVRGAADRRGVSSTSIVFVICSTTGGFGVLGLIVCYGSGRGLVGLTPGLIFISMCGGVMWFLSTLFFQFALSGGSIAAVAAIVNTNSIVVLVLTLVVFAVVPPMQKLVGMVLCLAGISILTLASAPNDSADNDLPEPFLSKAGVKVESL